MNFFGRTQKLKELTAFYDREEENLAVIYGRRRVGKSELVCQSLKGRTEAVIYFACRQTAEADNAAALSALAAECLKYRSAHPCDFSRESSRPGFEEATCCKILSIRTERIS